MSLPFILYAIYPFLKSGRLYVNTSDSSFYTGSGENLPVKLITELNIGDYETGGGDEPSANPNWPALKDLTLGNTITWASKQWIVSHVTSTEAYLTLNGIDGNSTWYGLQDACTTFANQLTETQKACLKSVAAGNTSGIVFVATRAQMDCGFTYFTSNSRRSVGGQHSSEYFTSSEYNAVHAFGVNPEGSIYYDEVYDRSRPCGFRPSVCIDLTKYTVS